MCYSLVLVKFGGCYSLRAGKYNIFSTPYLYQLFAWITKHNYKGIDLHIIRGAYK
jgi:hypothetical protein